MALKLILCILSIAVSAEMAAGVDFFKPINYFCKLKSNTRNFSSGSQYENNLNFILHDLSNKTPATGLGLAYAGTAENSNRVYGRAQCRGDVSAADCKTCMTKIGRWIRGKCPFTKSAFAWFQGCFLKYSDDEFFGKLDVATIYLLVKRKDLSRIAPLEKVNQLMTDLSSKAYASEKMFAKGVVKLARSTSLYGFVQCSLDISLTDCKKCIDAVIGIVDIAYGNGTQLFTPTCTVQYLLYPFFNV